MPKLVSFNVNGIRARPHQLEALKARHDPLVIGIQECKVADDAFPVGMIEELGYVPSFHGQKGHYGVALLSKEAPRSLFKGFPTDADDAQRRAITGTFGLPDGQDLTVINGYFPQGESRDHPTKFPNKRRFYADLALYLRQQFQPDQNLVLMGDMNVARWMPTSVSVPTTPNAGSRPASAVFCPRSAIGSRASWIGVCSMPIVSCIQTSTIALAGSTTAPAASSATPSAVCASIWCWSRRRCVSACATLASITPCAGWRSPLIIVRYGLTSSNCCPVANAVFAIPLEKGSPRR
jgi:hypothetical protein